MWLWLELLLCLTGAFLVCGLVWWRFSSWLRSKVFKSDTELTDAKIQREGKEKLPPTPQRNDEAERPENTFDDHRKYHNEAIYRDFGFFMKVSLAILGGVAYLVLESSVRPKDSEAIPAETLRLLLYTSGFLVFFSGLVFSIFIMYHQKSKIERWFDRPTKGECFVWQEFCMIASIMMLATSFLVVLVPALQGTLSAG